MRSASACYLEQVPWRRRNALLPRCRSAQVLQPPAECVTNVSDGWINGYSFLNVFITFLVVGSLLGIDRDVLIKSGSLYIPTLLCSLLGACVFGVVAGLIFGNDPLYLITSYVLPIMGGGAGAGAVPMAQVYSDATGQDSAGYLSFCMAILALAISSPS